MNLSTCVDSSTNTITDRNRQNGTNNFWQKKFHGSGVRCHVSSVSCHLSLTVTATATDPPPANSPTMQSRLVCKPPNTRKDFKMPKIIETAKLQNLTSRPIDWIGIEANSVKYAPKGGHLNNIYELLPHLIPKLSSPALLEAETASLCWKVGSVVGRGWKKKGIGGTY